MGKVVSTFLLVAFMLISALANLGDAHMGSSQAGSPAIDATAMIENEASSQPAQLMSNMGEKAVAEKDDCPCKQDHSASKFVCGVTLALADTAATLHTPTPSKARFVLNKSASIPDFVDRLKRPPRTIL